MNHINGFLVGLVMTCGFAADANAQMNVGRFGTERSRVYATVGFDPALLGSIGYGQVVRVLGHDFQVAGEAGLVATGGDVSDARARVTTTTSLLQWRSVRLTGSASAVARQTENAVYRAVSIGADATASLGIYRHGWFAAAEFGKDKSVVTHVKHTSSYRENFFNDAKDGWYLDAGGYYRYGLAAGFAIGRMELSGRAGRQKTEKWNDMAAPFYASFGLGVGL